MISEDLDDPGLVVNAVVGVIDHIVADLEGNLGHEVTLPTYATGPPHCADSGACGSPLLGGGRYRSGLSAGGSLVGGHDRAQKGR
jgi:hypothetical protein